MRRAKSIAQARRIAAEKLRRATKAAKKAARIDRRQQRDWSNLEDK